MTQRIVIVGAGQAGGQLAAELRQAGFDGSITLIGEEPHPPYKRPPLSKAYLAGTATLDSLYVMPTATFDKAQITFVASARVSKIDRVTKVVRLEDGRHFAYDKLALCTGGRARPLIMEGANKRNVFLVRTIADIDAMRQHCAPGKRVAIVGGGFIGLEVAAILVKAGLKVTVLEGLPRVLARVTVPQLSEFFERVHREAGVDLRTSVQIKAFEGDAMVTHVALADGTRLEADFVVIGIGLIPNVELAQEAGLAIDNGIVVDENALTSDPDIAAAGDCTNHPNRHYGRRVRLESVQNAMEQGRAAAHTLAGKPQPYHAVPWFWSDQYDVKLQMAGLSHGFDQIVLRGDPKTQRSFAVFYLGDGRLLAADCVSRPQDFAIAKKLVAMRAVLDPGRLSDENTPLKSFIPT
jgi:3-phenylpropionate/trans-cinnamate dioxygenase ferredoxin reductase subunit